MSNIIFPNNLFYKTIIKNIDVPQAAIGKLVDNFIRCKRRNVVFYGDAIEIVVFGKIFIKMRNALLSSKFCRENFVGNKTQHICHKKNFNPAK